MAPPANGAGRVVRQRWSRHGVELVDWFDFAVNEQCHEFDECELNRPFLDTGKPVFHGEYATRFVDDPAEVCATSLTLGLRTLLFPLELDGSFRTSCDDR